MIPIGKIASLAAAILLPNGVGILGAAATRKEVTGAWYQNLKKPWFNPPNLVFPIAWTTLYTTMGVASHMIYESGNGFQGAARLPLALYAAHLVFNGIWNPIFFVGHRLGWALLDIFVIDALVAACIYTYYPVNPTAAYLMIPYLCWTSFATLLNASIWYNNCESCKQEKEK